MSAWATSGPGRPRGLLRRLGGVGLVVLAASWTLAVAAVVARVTVPIPPWATLAWLLSIVAIPLACLAAWFAGAAPAQPLLRPVLAWIGLVTTAVVAAVSIAVSPVVALAVPVILLSTAVVRRHRVAAALLAFLLAGTFGSLTAFTHLKVGPLEDLLLAGLILGALWEGATGAQGTRVIAWPGVIVLGVYLFITALEVLLAPTLGFGLLAFRSAAWYLMAGLVLAYLPWRSGELERFSRGAIVVIAGVAGYAVLRQVIGPAPQEWSLAISSASIYNFVDGKLRSFGSFTSGHELGAWSAAMVPFAVAYALAHRDRWGALAAVAAGLGFVALLGSEVRIGLVALAVGLVVVLVLFQSAHGFAGLHLGTTAVLVALAAIVGIGGFAAIVGTGTSRSQRFANILTPDRDPAYQARMLKWRTALPELDREPLGHGIGTAGRVQRQKGRYITVATANVDNGYLKMAWEQGYAVMALYAIGVLLLLWGLGRRAVATLDGRRAGLAIGAAGTLAAFLVLLFAALYDEGLTALATWLLVGVGVGQFARLPRAQLPDA